MFGDRIRKEFEVQHTLSADATKVIGRADGAEIITGCDVFNASALATHATNYVTFKLINMGTDATGTTVIASASTSQAGGTAMAAMVAFPLSVVAAAKAVADGEAIGLIYDESTTDVANSHELKIVVRRQSVGPSSS